MPILSSAAQNAFSEAQMGVVTSGIQFFKLLGSTISSAVMGTILNASITKGIQQIDLSKLPVSMSVLLKDPSILSNSDVMNTIKTKLPANLLPAFGKVIEQIKHILANSIHDVFIICLAIAVIAFISAFFLKEIPLAQAIKKGE